MWATLVAGLQAAIFTLGHLTGSLGLGIFLVSLLLRLALLPLALRVARRTRAQQQRLAALRPELERLKLAWAKDPQRLHTETMALFRRHGYNPIDFASAFGGLLQLPPLSAMFSALRGGLGAGVPFAWVTNLARPDVGLALVVTALTAAAAAGGAVPGTSRAQLLTTMALAGGLTAVFLLNTSSAMGVSVAAGSAVNALQSWWLRRTTVASA